MYHVATLRQGAQPSATWYMWRSLEPTPVAY